MRDTPKIRELDALRGIAIALVYCFHAYGDIGRCGYRWDAPPPGFQLVAEGHTGVSLFFVLSAFLLSRPLFTGPARVARMDWREFYRRRVRRIMPLYTVAVLATTAFCAQRPADLLRALPHLTFLASWGPWNLLMVPYPPEIVSIASPWWSLRAEVQFYLLLPLVALALRSLAGTVVLIAAATAVYGVFVASLFRPVDFSIIWSATGSVIGRGPVFAAGIVVAWLVQRHGAAVRGALARLGGWGCSLLLVAALAGLVRLLAWTETTTALARDLPPLVAWHALEGGLWAAVLLLVVAAPLRGKAVVVNRAWVWLGDRSYSIYLLHAPILYVGMHALRTHGPHGFGAVAAAIVALTVVTLAASSFTWAWIEQPFLTRRPRPADAPPTYAAAVSPAAPPSRRRSE